MIFLVHFLRSPSKRNKTKQKPRQVIVDIHIVSQLSGIGIFQLDDVWGPVIVRAEFKTWRNRNFRKQLVISNPCVITRVDNRIKNKASERKKSVTYSHQWLKPRSMGDLTILISRDQISIKNLNFVFFVS